MNKITGIYYFRAKCMPPAFFHVLKKKNPYFEFLRRFVVSELAIRDGGHCLHVFGTRLFINM